MSGAVVQWSQDITNSYITNTRITNDIFQPSKIKMYRNEPQYNEPPDSEHIFLVPWHFFISRFHCKSVCKFEKKQETERT